MKKYLIITATCFYLLTSCSKVDTTPSVGTAPANQEGQSGGSTWSNGGTGKGTGGNETQPVAKPGPTADSKCFTITNNEKNLGIREYRFDYVDCEGNALNVALPAGESVSICSTTGIVRPNFGFSFVLGGDCSARRTPTQACENYGISNPYEPSGLTLKYEYYDCSGLLHRGIIDPQATINVLAQPGSVSCPGGVINFR